MMLGLRQLLNQLDKFKDGGKANVDGEVLSRPSSNLKL